MSTSVAMQNEQALEDVWQATGTEGAPNLKQAVAERLAAHRHRRAAAAAHEAELEIRTRQHREAQRQAARDDQRRGASTVRDAVKARYEQRESYREFLAAEAERAIAQAQAEADVAARNARAVAESQMQLLEELDQLNRPDPGPREFAFARAETALRGELAHALADIVLGAKELIAEPPRLTVTETEAPRNPEYQSGPAVREISSSGLTVRLFEDIPAASAPRIEELSVRHGAEHVGLSVHFAEPEPDAHFEALDEEIAFRRAPEFPAASPVEMQPIPGNIIEFPRELVAPRRARPRLAEGPLLDEPAEPQLRIFEVEADQLSLSPMMADPEVFPEWQNILLDSVAPVIERDHVQAEAQAYITLQPQTASIERRLMSAAMDGCIVATAWLGAVAVVAELCGPALRSVALPTLGAAAAGSLGLFAVLFQLLFFTLSDATPGMRWARIGLCTFGDSNPSRKAMRRRVFSTLLAACPLGLGFAWMWMDNDGMGWHDRMSRMYQRAY